MRKKISLRTSVDSELSLLKNSSQIQKKTLSYFSTKQLCFNYILQYHSLKKLNYALLTKQKAEIWKGDTIKLSVAKL